MFFDLYLQGSFLVALRLQVLGLKVISFERLVQVLHQRSGGGGGLTENTDAADALRRGSQVKVGDVILVQNI